MTARDNHSCSIPQKNKAETSPAANDEPPRITVTDENVVISVFRVPVAGSWWG